MKEEDQLHFYVLRSESGGSRRWMATISKGKFNKGAYTSLLALLGAG